MSKSQGNIVLAGSLAQKPHRGGHTWQFLQYLLGLRRLGWNVLFVDRLEPDMCLDEHGRPCPVERSVSLSYFSEVMSRFGLSDAYSLIYNHGEKVFGQPRSRVLEHTKHSALLLNVMGFLDDEEILGCAPRRVFLDTDPGFDQMWQALGLANLLDGYDDHVTIAENIGEPGCAIPTCGLNWIRWRQPVVLEEWSPDDRRHDGSFTTIASWRGPYGPIEYEGKTYGLKVHEFRKFVGLPALTGESFEIALNIHAAEAQDLELLKRNRWQLADPEVAAADPWVYRDYIGRSKAEFMAAKGIYVDTWSGWFSERSICYLATGKPVVAQDTGLAPHYPIGEGLLTFSTIEEAAAAVEEVSGNYDHHAAAARELAVEYFDSDKVLGQLLSALGVA